MKILALINNTSAKYINVKMRGSVKSINHRYKTWKCRICNINITFVVVVEKITDS